MRLTTKDDDDDNDTMILDGECFQVYDSSVINELTWSGSKFWGQVM